MDFHERLQRLANIRCVQPTVQLELPNGHVIYCRDMNQAELLERLWQAFAGESTMLLTTDSADVVDESLPD